LLRAPQEGILFEPLHAHCDSLTWEFLFRAPERRLYSSLRTTPRSEAERGSTLTRVLFYERAFLS
jgi:hypothetical protein